MTIVDPLLKKLGWNAFFGTHFREYAGAYEPGRISTVHKTGYLVYTKDGEIRARIAGSFRQNGDQPATGDWVALSKDATGLATIHAVLPRKSKFSRKDAGRATGEQVLVTNIDTVFLVTSLNKDFNLRRLERYLAIARDSGAEPVVILSKADICEAVDERIAEVKEIAPDVAVHAISSAENRGLEQLSTYLQEGRTVALLGSSGVGKSTLVNALEGRELLKTGDIREDDSRGRHVTTERTLIMLERGGIIIDNPGMRELQLWDAGDGLLRQFADIEALGKQCKFSDCRHETEPGCAIKQALSDGTLSAVRLESYRKLQKEQLAIERKKNPALMAEERKKWKKIGRLGEVIRKSKERGDYRS